MGVDRRGFLQASIAASGVFAFGPAFWQDALAAPAVPGPGPYGPPGPADAATGIGVPAGFAVREIARGDQVVGATGYAFPRAPDGSGCFPGPDGGWVLAVNSEIAAGNGGASALRFGADGTVVGAQRILAGTTANCAGGVTPWGTWLSGEEFGNGSVWECDPLGGAPAIARPAMGVFSHEAVCVDQDRKQLYLTEDVSDGCFYRFTPTTYPDLSAGQLDVMAVDGAGKVTWLPVPRPLGGSADPTRNQVPGATRFQRGEGCWFDQGIAYFVTTTQSRLWAFHVADQVLELVYDGSALGLSAELRDIDNVTVHPKSGDVFVAEDTGSDRDLGIITPERHAARFLTANTAIHDGSELTGPSFDPSGTRLYLSSQRAHGGLGAVYEITGPFRQQRPAPVVVQPPPPAPAPDPGAGAPAAPAPAPGVSPPDRRAPRTTLRVLGTFTLRGVRRSGLPVALRSDEAATVEVTVRERLSRGRLGPVLMRRTRKVRRGEDLRLRLQFGRVARRRLRRRRTVPVEVRVRSVDGAKNAGTVRRNLRLR